jgi:hypothetical protein
MTKRRKAPPGLASVVELRVVDISAPVRSDGYRVRCTMRKSNIFQAFSNFWRGSVTLCVTQIRLDAQGLRLSEY